MPVMRLLALLAIAAALLAGGADAATTAGSSTDSVTVGGTGTATAVPDVAEFAFTVQTKGATAAATLGRNSTDTISVTKVAIAKAGTVIDAAVSAGATGVSGPSLTVSSQDDLYAQALKAAVAQAKTKAQALAEAAGRTLGPVTTIVEGGNAVPLPFAAGAKANSTPIEAGTQEIQATVTVTYALS